MTLPTISETIHRALASAGLDLSSPGVKNVTDTIHKALENAGLIGRAPATDASTDEARTIEAAPAAPRRAKGIGEFLDFHHVGPAGARDYKLYVPSSAARRRPLPLLVMLHGCQQNPGDFAAGTRMNELAEREGFLVAYPAQTSKANGSNCWNWFQPQDQVRDGGEPSIIAGIVAEIASRHAVDKRRVFVAGMSAGASMAVILGMTYPEVFAAVGAHSGLPYGAAQDIASAFAAMHGGTNLGNVATAGSAVPLIVFQGDQDHTVVEANADAMVRQAVAGFEARQRGRGLLETLEVKRASTRTRACTSKVYTNRDGRPCIEQWTLKGGTHAWSGGSSSGSFTDERGPDASAEMVRFFLAQ